MLCYYYFIFYYYVIILVYCYIYMYKYIIDYIEILHSIMNCMIYDNKYMKYEITKYKKSIHKYN